MVLHSCSLLTSRGRLKGAFVRPNDSDGVCRRARRHVDRCFTIQSSSARSNPISNPAFSLSIHLCLRISSRSAKNSRYRAEFMTILFESALISRFSLTILPWYLLAYATESIIAILLSENSHNPLPARFSAMTSCKISSRFFDGRQPMSCRILAMLGTRRRMSSKPFS